jgi:hypothetical protein
MSRQSWIAMWLGALALLLVPTVAFGQAAKKAEEKKEDDAPKVKVERGAGGKKVYVIKTGFVIEGRIQKPNAFYVLQRSQINYDWAALKQDFVPNITEAVKKHPF